MRHGKKINHLSRTTSHRKAMLSNMATSLLKEKRINTTVAKAKALRKYVEPLITKAKTDTTHSRRIVFSYLQDKDAVQTLFDEVAGKIASRPGGYTRIIKTGQRLGDAAEMCLIELVDYNSLLVKESKPSTGKKRSRRGSSKKSKSTTEAPVEAKETEEAVVEDAVVVEETNVEEKKETKPEAEISEVAEESSEESKKDKPEAKVTEEKEEEKKDSDSEEEKKDQ